MASLFLFLALVAFAVSGSGTGGTADAVIIDVDFDPSGAAPFEHFWRSCGWCPPDPHPEFASYFLTEGSRVWFR